MTGLTKNSLLGHHNWHPDFRLYLIGVERGRSVDTTEIRRAIQAAQLTIEETHNAELAMPHVISALQRIAEMLEKMSAGTGKMGGV